jgi:uncharacterized protein (TIGR02145 family)
MKNLILSSVILTLLFGCKKNVDDVVPSIKQEEVNNYKTVVIGNQTWMKDNLDVVTYRNGDTIPEVEDKTQWSNLTTGAWCYTYDTSNGKIYGKVYNYYAVQDPRGLVPEGWHLPSQTDFQILSNFLGGDSIAGGKLKSTGTLESNTGLWYSPNLGATNSSGFNALPGGGRTDNGCVMGPGYYVIYWTTSVYNDYGQGILLSSVKEEIFFQNYFKNYANYIRCIKN